MLIISHRGNLEGPDSTLENHPDQIKTALKRNFHAEIDVRYIDNKWWLGHDEPQYQIDFEFLYQNREKLFIHAKNIITLNKLVLIELAQKHKFYSRFDSKNLMEYFFHDQDDCALTARGYIWTFPGKTPLTNRSIAVMPERVLDPTIVEWHNLNKPDPIPRNVCFGICTDYAFDYWDRCYGL